MKTFANLALLPGVQIEASVKHPTGRGARNPHVLLTEIPLHLDGQPLSAFLDYRDKAFDTYDGHNQPNALDWYAITFPEPTTFNCLEMTMECPHRDGGWWTSLDVEVKTTASDAWQPVLVLEITPPYHFEDVPYGRRPYETHVLSFADVHAIAVRIIGKPGGLAQFTSLTRLAVFHRDWMNWYLSMLPPPPVPYIFRLIAAATVFDLSESLVKLTGLSVGLAYMDYYLDKDRYERWWRRISRNYQGEPELRQLLGVSIGWENWNRLENPLEHKQIIPRTEPYTRFSFHQTLGRAVAPIVVEDQVVAEMNSQVVILTDDFDKAWHRRYAADHHISWRDYEAAVQRTLHLSAEQLEGAASLMGMIANNIANLAHRNLKLEGELDVVRSAAQRRQLERREIVRKAIDYMKQNLESPLSVADVARTAALSPTYFGVMFIEQTGSTPLDYLTDLRLERAKYYLAHTTMTVMDVCVALGYDPSYFNRLFKRRVGCTPGQYARQTRSG
jgi:AraC-like DNA-binding protein